MIDIVGITNDLGIFNSQVGKAENILAVQLGWLTYAPDLGIDLAYFLAEEYEFQNESFRAYLMQRLAEHSIEVASVLEQVDALYKRYTFNLVASEQNAGLVR